MNTKKLLGLFTLGLSLLLLAITFLSIGYEYSAYSAYAKTKNLDELYVVLKLTLHIIFTSPIVFVSALVLLFASVRYLRGRAGNRTRKVCLIVKAIAAFILLVMFIAYLILYPTGWVSKAFYLVGAILCGASFFMDFYFIPPIQQAPQKSKKQSK